MENFFSKNTNEFKIRYAITTFNNHGGDIEFQPEKELEIKTNSEDLDYAFIDVYEHHKYDHIHSLKILSIEKGN